MTWHSPPYESVPFAAARLRQPDLLKTVGLLLILLLLYLLGADGTFLERPTLNATVPFLLMIICLVSAYSLIRRNVVTIFTPVSWIFLSSAAYYGWGALIYHWGSKESVGLIHDFYYVDELVLWRTNVLDIVGLATILASFSLALRVFPLRNPAGPPIFTGRATRRFVLVCLFLGAPFRYLLVPLDNNSDILGKFIPSQLLKLQEMVSYAIMLMVWQAVSDRRSWRRVLPWLLGVELVLRVTSGSKMEFFMFLLPVFLGFFLAMPRPRLLATASVLGIFVWLFTVNVTRAIRQEWRFGGGQTVGERIDVLFSVFRVDEDPARTPWRPGVQNWWTRLSYSGAQSFCLDSYDRGMPGDTFRIWYWAFVPRALVPSKPEMTLGQSFNLAVTGNPNSHSAPGLFAEAYWNGGWTYVVVVSIYVGLLFLALTHIATYCLLRSDFRWLPMVWVGILNGIRIDDWTVATYLGGWPIGLSSCLVLYLLFPELRRGGGRRG